MAFRDRKRISGQAAGDASPAAFISCHMKLSDLTPGERGRIIAVAGGAPSARLEALGILPGVIAECFFCHPSGDPVAYLVGETVVAMRRGIADSVTVVPLSPKDLLS